MAKENVVKAIKGLGWDYIGLTTSYKGAVKQYGKVAVGFNMEEAFIVRDDLGLFTAKDLEKGVMKAKDINIEDSGDIVGLEIIAFYDEDEAEVVFNEDLMTELGIFNEETQEDLKVRLTALFRLTELKAIKAEPEV